MTETNRPDDDVRDQQPTALPASSDVGPGLVLVSTPIGNLADLSPRARAALANADLLLCEDTRTTARLLAACGIGGVPLAALHDHNEQARIPAMLARLRAGQRLALVSDAGTPLLSDPGYRLVRAILAAALPITAIPGPNAALTALTLSGLPPHPFLFVGFPPPKAAARRAAFATLRAAEQAGLQTTLLWHEAPHRLSETLADLHTVFGDRPAAIARELTKRFEELRRGPLSALIAQQATDPARGEITLVLAPALAPTSLDDRARDAALETALRAALARGERIRDAAEAAALATGVSRKTAYARALALRD